MGTTFLGCHAGPRLFSKKDRAPQADKRELAEKDKGKFIHKKKVRPESEYRRVDDDDERVAKSDSKSKPKANPIDSIRKPSSTGTERAVAARKPADDESMAAPRSTKPAATPSKTAKPDDQSQIARRDIGRRPVTDLLKNSTFDDELPEPAPSASAATAKKAVTRPTPTAKVKPAVEDPFKNSVASTPNAKRPNNNVANVNFDDEDLDLGLDDELEEEAKELAEAKALAAQKAAAMKKVAAPARESRTTPVAGTGQRKFLDEIEDSTDDIFATKAESPRIAATQEKARANLPTVKRTADAAKTIAGQEVIDRRQRTQQTANQWRHDWEQDALAEPEQEPIAHAPMATSRPNSAPISRGHLSPTDIDEFVPSQKSQGAVLNGELIIDTNNLPSRFQRSTPNTTGTNNSSSVSGRTNSNAGANVEIAPGVSQNRARPAGQISLQGLSDTETSSGLTTADYTQSSQSEDLGGLPSLKNDSETETGPKLTSLEGTPGIAPPPPNVAELAPAIGVAETPPASRGWKRTLLVLSAMISALGIGFALRRRAELSAVPIYKPNSESSK
jgi:hypothetical protein